MAELEEENTQETTVETTNQNEVIDDVENSNEDVNVSGETTDVTTETTTETITPTETSTNISESIIQDAEGTDPKVEKLKKKVAAEKEYETLKAQLEQVKIKQDNMRREYWKSNKLSSLSNNKKYKKLISENALLSRKIHNMYYNSDDKVAHDKNFALMNTAPITISNPSDNTTPGVNNSSMNYENVNEGNTIEKVEADEQYDLIPEIAASLDNASIIEYNQWAEENDYRQIKFDDADSESNFLLDFDLKTSHGVPELEPLNIDPQYTSTPKLVKETFSIDDEKKYYLATTPSVRNYPKEQIIKMGYTLSDFTLNGSFGDYYLGKFRPEGTQTLGLDGKVEYGIRDTGQFDFGPGQAPIGDEQVQYANEQYKIGPSGEINIMEPIKKGRLGMLIEALDLTDEFNNVNWTYQTNAKEKVNEIFFEGLMQPENKDLLVGLMDNSANQHYLDQELIRWEDGVNDLIPEKIYHFKSTVDLKDGDKLMKAGTLEYDFTFDDLKVMAARSGFKTVDEYIKSMGDKYSIKEEQEVKPENAPANFNELMVRLKEESEDLEKEAMNKGMSNFYGNKFTIYEDTWLYNLQKEQGDVDSKTASYGGAVGVSYEGIFDKRDVDVLETLMNDQYNYEVILAKESRTIEDDTKINELKLKYKVSDEKDLKIISERRAKLIEVAVGKNFLNDAASLLFNPGTGELFDVKSNGEIVNENTGEVSLTSQDLVDYRLYLKNKYQGTNIEAEILRTYYKLQAFANEVGDVNRGEFSTDARLSFLPLLWEGSKMLIGLQKDAQETVDNILDPSKKLEQIMTDVSYTTLGGLETYYNDLVKQLRDLSAYRVMNFSPLEMKRGGFGEGFEKGSEEFIGIQMEGSTSYEMATTYRNWAEGLGEKDRKVAMKGYKKWFNEDGTVKEKWSYGVGFQTPFWLRLSGEMALTELTFGGAIASTVNTLSKLSKASYITAKYGRGSLKNYKKVKEGLRLHSGSFVEKFTNDYSTAAMKEFSKLYVYNKTFAKMPGGGEMPYAFTIMGPMGVGYGKFMQSLFKKPVRLPNGEMSKVNIFAKWNQVGQETIPYWQMLTLPVREGFQAGGTATMLGVGMSFEEAIHNQEFSMADFKKHFTLEGFTQNMALSLIMRGTSGGAGTYKELSQRYKMDIAYARSRKWYKEAVKQANDNFGVSKTYLDKDGIEQVKTAKQVYEEVDAKKNKLLKDGNFYELGNMLEVTGFKFSDFLDIDAKTKEGRQQIKQTIYDNLKKMDPNVRKVVEGVLDNFLTGDKSYKDFMQVVKIQEQANTLKFDIECDIFKAELSTYEERDAKFSKSVDNFLQNKLTAEDYNNLASMSSPEVFEQYCKDKGITDQPTLELMKETVVDAMFTVEQLVNNNVPIGSKEANKIISNQIKINQVKSKIEGLKQAVKENKLGAKEDLVSAEGELQALTDQINKDYDYAINDAAQFRAAQAIDNAIKEREASGGEVVAFDSPQKLENELQDLIDKGEINAEQIPDLIGPNGKVKVPKGISVEAMNLYAKKALSTGERVNMPYLFIDFKGKNINIDLHEGSHPIINILLRRMGIKGTNSPMMNKFITNFRETIPQSLRDIVDARVSNDLNIDFSDPASYEGKDLTEYFTRFIEEVSKRNFDIKDLYTKENFESMKMLEEHMVEMLKGDVVFEGGEINLDLGVNFILQIAKQGVEAKNMKAFGPAAEVVTLDANEAAAVAEVAGGDIYMQASKKNDYKQSLTEKIELREMLSNDLKSGEYEGDFKIEIEKQVKLLDKEISTMESNIEISDNNWSDIKNLQELSRLKGYDANTKTYDEKYLVEDSPEQKAYFEFVDKHGLSYIENLENNLIERNIGAVDKIYNSAPINFDKSNVDLYKQIVKDEMLKQFMKYDPSKGSVYNHLQIVNKKWTDIVNKVTKDNEIRSKETPLEVTDANGDVYTVRDIGLEDRTLEEITNNIVIDSKSDKAKQEEEASKKSTDVETVDKISENFTSETGDKAKARILGNTYNFINSLNAKDYIKADGTVDHKKILTDFNKNSRSPSNQIGLRDVLKKPTKGKVLNKDGTANKNSDYYKELSNLYDFVVDFTYRNPQIIKNKTKTAPKEGEINWNSFVEFGEMMNVQQSIDAGTSVKNVYAGNRSYKITPPGLDAFIKMMIEQPGGASNPSSALESKYVQLLDIIQYDVAQKGVQNYIASGGKIDIFNPDGISQGKTPGSLNVKSSITEIGKVLSDVNPNPIDLSNSPKAQYSLKNILDQKQKEAFVEQYEKNENILFSDFKINKAGVTTLIDYRDKLIEDGEKDVYSKLDKIHPEANEIIDAYENLVDNSMLDVADMKKLNQENIQVPDATGAYDPLGKLNYRGKQGDINKKESAPYFKTKVEVEVDGKKVKKEVRFVNPTIWNRERGYSEALAENYASGGDISINHLTGQDYRSGVGQSNLFNYEIYKDTGELVPFEKYSGVTSVLKGTDKIAKNVPANIKTAIKGLNSLNLMNEVTAFIQYNEMPTNAKGLEIRGKRGPNGGYMFNGKEYMWTKEGRIELYQDVFTVKESKNRKEVFKYNYNVAKDWLNEFPEGSVEYNNRLLYLSRVAKEGSNLRKGNRNGVWNNGMVIMDGEPISSKLIAGDVYEHSNGVTVELTEPINTKVEHVQTNVSVESRKVFGFQHNLSYEAAFGDFNWTGLYGVKPTMDVIDGYSLVKTGGSAKNLGGGGPRLATLQTKNTYFVLDADIGNYKAGQAISLYDYMKADLKGTNKKKNNIVDQTIANAGDNLGLDPVGFLKKSAEINSNSKFKYNNGENKGEIPEGTSGSEANSQGMVIGQGTVDKYDANGNVVYHAKSQTTRQPNETGEFSSKRKVVITMGAPGSGKTTLLKAFMEKNNITSLTEVNMDIFKDEIREQFDLPADEKDYNAEERSLAGQIQALAIKEKNLLQGDLISKGDGMAIDMTGASLNSSNKIINGLLDNGYEVVILHAEVSKERSVEMNNKRGEEGNRSLPTRVVEKTWESVNNNINTYKELYGDNFFTVNTEAIERGTIPEDVSTALYNKLNANEIIDSPPAENNTALAQYSISLSDNVELKKNTIKGIMDRNLNNPSQTELSQAEMNAAKRKLKYKFRFLPNSFSHLSTLNSRFFKYHQDYEQVEAMINGTFDKETQQYNNYKLKIFNDYKALNSNMKKAIKADPDARLNMADKSVGEFTVEDAIRVYCFTSKRNGFKPSGLTEKNIQDLNNYVLTNEYAHQYAERLMNDVVSATPDGKNYFAPKENWQSGSIYTDMTLGVKSARSEFFKNTAENIEVVYGNGNLEKMALTVGDKTWADNVRGNLDFMLSGELSTYKDPTTRKAMGFMLGYTRLGLVGSVRSLVGQLTSSTLFLGYGRGVNPFTFAAKGLKDPGGHFNEVKLWLGSDYMKSRGQNFDLALAELQDLKVKWQQTKNKSVALSFALSSMGDKSAIAMGAFYIIPQRIEKIMKKEGLTRDEARVKAWEEFTTFVEDTQQSNMENRLGVGQRGIFGKIATGFLNAPIRYNNNALNALNRSLMKDVETGTVDFKKSGRQFLRFANYMVAQGYIFSHVQDGTMYTFLDDDLDPDKKATMMEGHHQRTKMARLETIINSTGTRGKILTSLYKGFEMMISDDPKQARKDGVDVVYEMIRNFAPALGVRGDLIKGLGWDIKDIKKQMDADGDGQLDKDYMPYLRASTKVMALLTNSGIPKEVVERMDDYEFIMNVRTTFWQKVSVIMGQSPWMVDKEIMKESVGKGGGGSTREALPGTTTPKEGYQSNKSSGERQMLPP